MAKIDDSVKKKVPELRFPGFTDDWEERKLGELGSVAMNRRIFKDQTSENEEVPFFKIGTFGSKPDAFISRELFEEYKLKYPYPEIGDVLISASGSIGRTVVYQGEDEYFQDSNIVWLKHDNRLDNKFLKQFYSIVKWQGLEGSTIKRLYNKNILDTDISIPSTIEQNKIGMFFEQLDDTIALHQRKLDLLKEQKKGYLQKMFPKNGAKVPELRFAGFADDWEERKLSSGLREYTDRVIVEDDKEYYQISVRNNFGGITLRGSKMGNKIGRKRQAKINLTKYPQTLIFTRQTVEQGGIGWVDKYCDGAIVTENMPTISLDTSVFSKYFLTNLFQTRIFYKNAILDNIEGGSAQIAIHESKFLSSTLLFPNLDEQEKIGQFFKQLDDTIDLHQRKLDLLKEQKKGFLQKMFV
ncbi:restriction endonuclease subunit S [Lactococcus lactis]|uniref:restriction endonuclease subunit S n=1 Tax=Lactococcus lactis TaxID=1358 RepID=UPI00325E4189